MQKPSQLTKEQVKILKEKSKGDAVESQMIQINSEGNFTKEFNTNENDVFLLNLVKQ
ncbi:hypothetical protein D3C87_2178350 [compost metagenome]